MHLIEDDLRALANCEPNPTLTGLEGDVWRAIRRSGSSLASLAPAATAGVIAALGLGTLVGGMSAAAQPPLEVAAFDVQASLAPSALLAGGS